MNTFEPEPVDYQRRPCYCFMWHEGRELLEKQRLPYGYCGWCLDCGNPGHTRHGPSGPYTGAWCDACWDKMVAEIKAKREAGAKPP